MSIPRPDTTIEGVKHQLLLVLDRVLRSRTLTWTVEVTFRMWFGLVMGLTTQMGLKLMCFLSSVPDAYGVAALIGGLVWAVFSVASILGYLDSK